MASVTVDDCVFRAISRTGSATASEIIRAGSGVVYPEGHATLWRRMDRAIQRLRKKGHIRFNGKDWEITDG